MKRLLVLQQQFDLSRIWTFMHKGCVVCRAGQFDRSWTLSGGHPRDYGRTARRRWTVAPTPRTLRSALRAPGGSRTVLDLPQRLARGPGPQERRTDGLGVR